MRGTMPWLPGGWLCALALLSGCAGSRPAPAPLYPDAPLARLSNGTDLRLRPGERRVIRVPRREVPGYPALEWLPLDTTVVRAIPLGPDSAAIYGQRPGRTRLDVRAARVPRPIVRVEVVVAEPAEPPPAWRLGPLVLRASASVAPDSAAWPGTDRLTATLEVTNTGDRPHRLRFGACPLRLAAADVYPEPPDDALPRRCPQPPDAVLPPGETRRLSTYVFGYEVYGAYGQVYDTPLAYRAHAVVNGAPLAFTLGRFEPAFGEKPLGLRASVGPDTAWGGVPALRVRAVGVNEGPHPFPLGYGGCATRLRLYSDSALTAPPLWDSTRRAPADGMGMYGCDGMGYVARLAPGDTLAFGSLVVPLDEILADSLRDGRYYFGASVRVGGAWQPEVPAGSTYLALERPPMPAARARDALTYRASPIQYDAGSDTLRVTVAVVPDAGESLRTWSDACSVQLLAYRTAARRDAAPRSGPPAWTSPPCTDGVRAARMRAGEPRTATVAAAAADLLRTLPPGPYHFAVRVRAGGSPVYLAAGAARLPWRSSGGR